MNDMTNSLNTIIANIAREATNMVEGAHRIGTELNKARELLVDDAAFGAWRVEHIEPLGISKRTAQRMQNIAERFTADTLPKVGLSVLYSIASDSVQPMVQEELLALAQAKADSGEALTARETTQWVARVNQGRATYLDIREDANAIRAIANPPAVIDNDTGEPVIPEPARRTPTDAEKQAEAEEWAKSVRRTLKRASNGKQHMMLASLLHELRSSGLLTVADSLTAVATTNGKTSHIEVTQ